MKRVLIVGFLFGSLGPMLLFGIALAGPPTLAALFQKLIEFSYIGVKFFNEPFGMLNSIQRVFVILSGGLLWTFIFYMIYRIFYFFRLRNEVSD